ncbi:PREDICTED: uncharacterized protein LOC106330333 [Brassica oleracea var. oleracea]|uniref:uncharacterized protein LOC106330333 n=1 Tax=Brassica oleracea var. oleracea TaxID=109376 RepID=UPI0006A6AE50|nr:PREDICTED: uncharacterized protein LOC106330333 [Brassica oleracea var. oleracea]
MKIDDETVLDDSPPEEQVYSIGLYAESSPDTHATDCFADCSAVNFSDCSVDCSANQEHFVATIKKAEKEPVEFTGNEKRKFLRDARLYFWDEQFLYRHCKDGVFRRCVPESEIPEILFHCHGSSYAGHFAAFKTVSKILQAGFWLPTMFRDAQAFISKCSLCQRQGNISKQNEMPQNFILEIEVFDCWGIDFMGPFLPSCKNEYILVAVDYISKWIHELEEIRHLAYESTKIYKEKSKAYHDKWIICRNFEPNDRVLLFNSRLNLFPGKLKSRWSGPFTVKEVRPYGAVVLLHPNGGEFVVNGQRIKPYMADTTIAAGEEIPLGDPSPAQ